MNSLPSLHDATLNDVVFEWSRGHVRLSVTIDVGVIGIIQAVDVTDLKCPRTQPWGPSSSINSATAKTVVDGKHLAIEMQSGDLIEIRCREISFNSGAS